jgi:hypothetical protein
MAKLDQLLEIEG